MTASTWFRLLGLSALLITLGFGVPAWTQAKAKGKKVALVVGVTKYDSSNFKSLRFTVNDAEELAKELSKPAAGFASVRVLSSTRGDKDAKDMPTAANVRAALKELLENRTRRDTVLIALAGHGMQLTVQDPDEKDDPRHYTYFCPTDASLQGISYKSGLSSKLILLDEVFEALGKCDARHKLALIDACRNDNTIKASQRSRLDASKVTIPDGVAALFSCGRGQFAWETEKLGGGHGVFFHFVIEGLRGEARNRERDVTWDSLADYVKRQVTRSVPKLIDGGARQTPASMGNLEGESPVLARIEKSITQVGAKGPLNEDGKNSLGMAFKRIPKGEFTMGASKDNDRDAGSDETPHKVKLTNGFFMQETEVTQGQFRKVMGYNPSYFSKAGKGDGAKYEYVQPAAGKEKVEHLKDADIDQFPVENVSYHEAVKFCDELNEQERKRRGEWKYSLPTEAQWEYACRGEASSYKKYHVDDSLTKAAANFNENVGSTTKTGSYPANTFGLRDMHGNVWEWCLNWYDSYPIGEVSDPSGPQKGSNRVSRGGSWGHSARFCRSAYRNSISPNYRNDDVGFRVVLIPTR